MPPRRPALSSLAEHMVSKVNTFTIPQLPVKKNHFMALMQSMIEYLKSKTGSLVTTDRSRLWSWKSSEGAAAKTACSLFQSIYIIMHSKCVFSVILLILVITTGEWSHMLRAGWYHVSQLNSAQLRLRSHQWEILGFVQRSAVAPALVTEQWEDQHSGLYVTFQHKRIYTLTLTRGGLTETLNRPSGLLLTWRSCVKYALFCKQVKGAL